ncbi:hypothetical protein SNEBB_006205 [Seison nebaliae]|nr:hypothetical protein SNEBB_006205 [Seison nebaliae]
MYKENENYETNDYLVLLHDELVDDRMLDNKRDKRDEVKRCLKVMVVSILATLCLAAFCTRRDLVTNTDQPIIPKQNVTILHFLSSGCHTCHQKVRTWAKSMSEITEKRKVDDLTLSVVNVPWARRAEKLVEIYKVNGGTGNIQIFQDWFGPKNIHDYFNSAFGDLILYDRCGVERFRLNERPRHLTKAIIVKVKSVYNDHYDCRTIRNKRSPAI